MTSDEIRQQFISFFQQHGHHNIRGTPLVLADDPSLLFTNAGMNQFKPIFLNLEIPQYTRAVNSQRCMRVSGKHNDLDEVGFSPHHHTLFEMLGNWSFGDYYKQEAIVWAWQLLTDVWNLPKSKLWVSVFRDETGVIPADDEAASLWATMTDVPKDHIVFFGRKENFWEMGETGPCGPCTEIHIDRGPDFCNLSDRPHRCSVNGDCRRYIEIWNLVFMQYNRKSASELVPLPMHHVDTGMGLERITAIIQEVGSNYDTDLFKPIISRIFDLAGLDFQEGVNPFPFRVIADHARAASCLIADGIVPSNESRGYVLRRIIRRAMRFGKKIGFDEPFLCDVSKAVVSKLGHVFPELLHAESSIFKIIKFEEERFFKTLNQAIPFVDQLVGETLKQGGSILPGAEVFRLYDTLGFPVDLTQEIAQEYGLSIDFQGYQSAMESQKQRARSAIKGPEKSSGGVYESLVKKFPQTLFNGYTHYSSPSKLLAILSNGQEVTSCDRTMSIEIMINPSPFYAESGGQTGDIGVLRSDFGLIKILNTKKIGTNHTLLSGTVIEGSFHVGDPISAEVNLESRIATARNHTATHLLHATLKECIGDHVKQAGSLVTPDRLRFDFTHFAPLDSNELITIERQVNSIILSNMDVVTTETDIDSALNAGVTALFGEKYGENVRVVRIADVSAELCGGTHVQRTGSIGQIKILSEAGVAAGIRRIEAITGTSVQDWFQNRLNMLDQCSRMLKCEIEALPEKVDIIQKQIKQLTKEVERFQTQHAHQQIESTDVVQFTSRGTKFIARELSGLQPNQLREIADQMKAKLGSGIVILATRTTEKANLLIAVTPDLVTKFNARDIIQKIAILINGTGGGRPDMAQAGGSARDRVPEALKAAEVILNELDA